MTERLAIEVTVVVRSPFLFRGLGGGLVGLDAAQLRDECGVPILPGTQLQGVLRDALTELSEAAPDVVQADDIDRLFGKGSAEADEMQERDRPVRALALIGDLTADPPPGPAGETTRIEIDDTRGAVRTGYLQIVELSAPFGQEITFRGEIVLFWGDGTVSGSSRRSTRRSS